MVRRRVRVRGAKGGSLSEDTRHNLDGFVNQISKDLNKQTTLSLRIAMNMERLEELMKEKKVSSWEADLGDAKTVTPTTRAANKIDVKKFAKAVNQKDFSESITVPMANAKKVLAEKDLEKVIIHGRTTQQPDQIKVIPKVK